MFKFLFFVFLLFVLFVFLFGFSILRLLFGGIFGTKPNHRQRKEQSQSKQNQNQTNSSTSSKKIIASDEGEYVDYIEIKD